jgi:glucose-1-phosphate adenylyltransferase
VVFGADHVYRMDPRQMVAQHVASGAAVTVAGIRVPRSEARSLGVIDADRDGRIRQFLEKPADPPGLPDAPDQVYASMGNYVFSTGALLDVLRQDADNEDSVHDMGGSIMPAMVEKGVAYVYDFAGNDVPGATDRDRGYWRDVGTIDAYYEAHMDLVAVHPIFNLSNPRWPIYTYHPHLPPAKFVEGGGAQESIVGNGTIVSAATVRHSVISSGVRMAAGAYVEGAVIMDGAHIGRGAVVRRAILDKDVVVPEGAHIGVDPEHDRQRYHVTASGIVVLGKSQMALP